MNSRTGTIVFRILLVLLTIEAVYVAVTVILPPDVPAFRDRPKAVALASPTATNTPTADVATAVATATPKPVPTVRAVARRPRPTAGPVRKVVFAGADAFTYDGRWEHVRGHYDGRPGGTSSRSFHAGDRATLTFNGHFVRLYGVVGPGGGAGLVELDGGRLRRVVTFAAAAKNANALVFASPPLDGRPHRLTVAVLAPATGAASRFVNIAGANYGG